MMYLIGGTPRVGKTTLAKMIMERNTIPFISADTLTHALDHTYPDLKLRNDGWGTIPDKFFPFLKEFVRTSGWNLKDYIIEGDSFFPKHVHELSKEFDIKSVFMGTSSTSLEKIKGLSDHDDWVSEISQEEQEKLPAWCMEISEMFRIESKKFDIPYVDMCSDREKKLEEAYSYLFL